MIDWNKYKITENLKTVLKELDIEQKDEISNMFEYYLTEFRKIPINDSSVLHNPVNETIKETIDISGDKISCSKGCGFCCHIDVTISESEAASINKKIEENNINIDLERLKRQSNVKNYSELKYQDRRCVFLDESDSCKIYEDRPISCRKLLVTSDPDLCNTEKYTKQPVKGLLNIETEAMVSASMNIGKSGRLSTMILNETKIKN
jgi:Fe-S-cluster containining protein